MTAPESVLVSVIVATNRAGEFLDEAIGSLAAQSETRYELIVVDDGSPDPTAVRQAAAAVGGAVVLRQAPGGPAAARNAGVRRARGRWLAFLDDDDRWHPDRLAAQLARFDADAAAVAGYCGMRTIDARGEVLIDADQVAVDDEADIARRRTGIILPNLMVRTDVFTEVGGFDPALRLAEDLDLLLRVAQRGPVVFEPRPLVDYRTHGDNVTRRFRSLVDAIGGVLRRHRAAAETRGETALVAAFDESLRKNDRYAWWAAGRAARASWAERHPATAVGHLCWALRTAPAGLLDGLRRRVRAQTPTMGAERGLIDGGLS
ncbi:hypothetical protein BOH66_13805 [Microbacterium aurum]|uniref:Glycosyltransferase 2-like domain-containing protein n=1 Tax=Microbacterium aurum TaxID=36805 RepID=A0A1P8UAS1_9MICO|nr:glycosyltransferase family A protein [Microbacterium aurum]APZ35200.1 hypothetical protein BOH66_13805 [Microbacterium aurum]MBM7829176.1 glycosyltransferase involved in cell wall biosynthesis [Microbacterium aurum]